MGVAVDTFVDVPVAFGVLCDRIAEENEKQETERCEHERNVTEPCPRKPEDRPHVETDGVEPGHPIDGKRSGDASDNGRCEGIAGDGKYGGERGR